MIVAKRGDLRVFAADTLECTLEYTLEYTLESEVYEDEVCLRLIYLLNYHTW